VRGDVVIATAMPTLAEGGERVLQLTRWLRRRGITVELVCLGEGTRPEIERFRSTAPTLIVDRLRRRGLAALPRLVRLEVGARGVKRWRLRRWLRRRSGSTFLLHHPLAASLVRYAPVRPDRVVAALPDPTWTLDRLRPEDLATLLDADGWITADATQTEDVGRRFDGPVLELGAAATSGGLIDPADLPPVRLAHGDRPGAVVLSPTIGMWDSADHAIEVACQLHRALPELELRWIADDDDDRWLAEHDVAHAGLVDVVRVVRSDDPELLDGISALVRTGYEPSHGDLALAAGLAGAPVLGMNTDDLPAAPATEPFAVEALVAEVVRLLTEPGAASAAGSCLRSSLSHLDLDHHVTAVAALLRPDRA